MGRRQEEEEEDPAAQLLPDDVLASILSLLAPRGLAVSRCVCPAWRALIDGRRLLRADLLLPRSLAGLFINYNNLPSAELFSRPSAEPITYQHLPHHTTVRDHCNGLLLLHGAVLNPATGRRAPLPEDDPPRQRGMECFYPDMFLVHDPTVSARYEVFAIPRVPDKDELP